MNALKSLITKGRAAALLLFGATFLVMTGCKEEDPPMISVSKENIQIGIEGQQVSVQVRSNTAWTATSDQLWCKLSTSAGYGTELLNLVVDYYEGTVPRKATITFTTNNGQTAQVLLTQSAANSTLMISPEQVTIDNKAQTVALAINSNDTWALAVDKPDLLSSAPTSSGTGNAMVNIAVKLNDTHMDRTITITVTAGTGSRMVMKTMTINQLGKDAPSLFVAPSALSFTAAASSNAVVITTNITGTPQVVSDFAWCTITGLTATGFTVNATANTDAQPRYAVVTVIASVDGVAVTQQVTVTQAGVGSPILTILGNNMVVDHNAHTGASVAFVKSNASITVTASIAAGAPAWLESAVIGGTGVNGTVTFNVKENTSTATRQGIIYLTATVGGETLVYPVNVIQDGVGIMQMQLAPSMVNVTAAAEPNKTVAGYITLPTASAKVIAVVSDGPSGMISNLSPATATNVAADGSFTVKFDVAANNGAATRTATILVTARLDEQTVIGTISVIQVGIGSPNVVVVPEAIVIPQDGTTGAPFGAQILGATTATSMATVTLGGFTATASGSPINLIGITPPGANPNPESITQVLYVVFTQGGATQVVALTITQLGTGSPKLTIPVTNFNFNAAGATNFDIAVVPDAGTNWSALTCPSWITVIADGGNVLTIDVDPNLSKDPLAGMIILKADKGGTEVALYTIGVTQDGVAAPDYLLATTEVYVPALVNTLGLNPVEVLVIGDDPDTDFAGIGIPSNWITSTGVNLGILGLTIQDNNFVSERSQTLTLTFTKAGQNQQLTLKVIQAGVGAPNVMPGVTAMLFGPAAETGVSVYLLNDNDATVTFKSAPSWISTPTVAATFDELTFDVLENTTTAARSGVIVLEASLGGQKAIVSIAVTQAAYAPMGVSLSTASLNLEAAATVAGTAPLVKLLNLPAGAAIELTSSDAWLTYTPVLPLPFDKALISVAENLGAARTGTIVAKVTDAVTGEVQYLTLVVNQAAADVKDLVVEHTIIELCYTGNDAATDTAPVEVIPQNYDPALYTSIFVSADWPWIKVPSGNVIGGGLAGRQISAEPNLAATPRQGVVTVTVNKVNGAQQIFQIPVMQEAAPPPIVISLFSGTFLWSGVKSAGDAETYVTYPGKWSVVYPAWITGSVPSATLFTGDTNFTFTVAPNNSLVGTPRTFDLVFTDNLGRTQTFTVTQGSVGAPYKGGFLYELEDESANVVITNKAFDPSNPAVGFTDNLDGTVTLALDAGNGPYMNSTAIKTITDHLAAVPSYGYTMEVTFYYDNTLGANFSLDVGISDAALAWASDARIGLQFDLTELWLTEAVGVEVGAISYSGYAPAPGYYELLGGTNLQKYTVSAKFYDNGGDLTCDYSIVGPGVSHTWTTTSLAFGPWTGATADVGALRYLALLGGPATGPVKLESIAIYPN